MNRRDMANLTLALALLGVLVILTAATRLSRASAHTDQRMDEALAGFEAGAGGDVRWAQVTPGAGHGAWWSQLDVSVGRPHPLYRSPAAPGMCVAFLAERGWHEWAVKPPANRGLEPA